MIGLAFRSSASDYIKNVDLNKNSLWVRQPGEGPIFAALKLMCISDSRLYDYMIKTKEFSQNNPNSTKVTFLNVTFWQNILNILKQQIIQQIVDEIDKNGGKFSIEVDTSSDNTRKEQVSVVVKYVKDCKDRGFIVVERTIVFKPIKSLSAKNLFNFINECLRCIGLSLKNVIGKQQIIFWRDMN